MKNLNRKILLALTVLLVATSIPAVLKELNETGQSYLFSERLGKDLISRFVGPGRFRFLFQPAIAMLLGIIGGKKDSAQGRPPYIYGILSGKFDRKEALKEGLDSIGTTLIIGVLADVIFQMILFRIVHILPALILGPILIALPYATARALSNRFFSNLK